MIAAPPFAPPEGVAMRYVVERSTDGPAPRRFRLERRVVFAHDRDGVVADVTLERSAQAPPSPVADAYARAQAPLVGRTIRFHFARDAAIVAIDGADAAFAAFVRGVAAMGAGAAAPLAALSPERRQAMLASIAGFVAGADAQAPDGTTAVAVASALPGGPAVRLTGTRIVSRDGDRVRIAVHATGEGVTLDRIRIVDAATGLLADERETLAITAGGVTRTSRSTATLESAV